MSYAHHIIDQVFGGSRKMAKLLTVAGKKYPPTTIQSWKDSGVIPSRHHDWVLRRARELDLGLEPKDFFTTQAEVKKRKRVTQ